MSHEYWGILTLSGMIGWLIGEVRSLRGEVESLARTLEGKR